MACTCNAKCNSNCDGDCWTSCGSNCKSGCAGTCSGGNNAKMACTKAECQKSCGGGCGGECKGGCRTECGACSGCDGCSGCTSCTGTCDTGCNDTCTGGCKETCNTSCVGGCVGNCDTSCSSSAVIEAYEKLKNVSIAQIMMSDDIKALETLIIHERELRGSSGLSGTGVTPGIIAKIGVPQVLRDLLSPIATYPRSGAYKDVTLNTSINAVTDDALIKNYIQVVLSLYEVVIPQK